ncbi:MAG: hypothetical protein WBQ89_09440 [Candidatus Acidiferrum sp.]
MGGGSLAREGPGLIPLVGVEPRDASAIEGETAFVLLPYAGDKNTELDEVRSRFRSGNIPFLHIEIRDPLELLTLSFQWEVATILACARLGIDPFDVSDNRLQRTFTDEILAQISRGENPLHRSPRMTDRLIQLHADGMARQKISTLNFAEALRTFLRIATPARHVTLLVNMDRTEEVLEKFDTLRSILIVGLQRPVELVFGPRAGEHYSYFFRDSLSFGPCIVFTTDLLSDKPIPGALDTFGQFYQALALSEYDTLAIGGGR